MILHIFIIPQLGSGPLWKDKRSVACVDNWWITVLYLQNFVKNAQVISQFQINVDKCFINKLRMSHSSWHISGGT